MVLETVSIKHLCDLRDFSAPFALKITAENAEIFRRGPQRLNRAIKYFWINYHQYTEALKPREYFRNVFPAQVVWNLWIFESLNRSRSLSGELSEANPWINLKHPNTWIPQLRDFPVEVTGQAASLRTWTPQMRDSASLRTRTPEYPYTRTPYDIHSQWYARSVNYFTASPGCLLLLRLKMNYFCWA